jgi:hypothetical protein
MNSKTAKISDSESAKTPINATTTSHLNNDPKAKADTKSVGLKRTLGLTSGISLILGIFLQARHLTLL